MDHDGTLPTLSGQRLTLRPTREGDVGALVGLLNEPEVHRWWGDNHAAGVREQMESEPCWTVLVDDQPVGWLQVHEERDEDYPSVAFDIALGGEASGRGLGPEALRLAIRHFQERGHHRFTIDPAVDNERAIRAYAAVGFKPVGVLRAYERAPDGSWRDGLLMDLVAEELID